MHVSGTHNARSFKPQRLSYVAVGWKILPSTYRDGFCQVTGWTVPALGEGSGLGIVLERHALARG